MKIQLVSDLHLEFDETHAGSVPRPEALLPATGADLIVLAGDIWNGLDGVEWAAELARARGTPVVMLYGNHDLWSVPYVRGPTIPEMLAQARARSEELVEAGVPVHFLEDEAVTIDGVRILGATLWTDYDGADPAAMHYCAAYMNDHRMLAGRPDPERLLARHRASRAWLEKELTACDPERTVVVTHHAPSYRSNPGGRPDEGMDLAHAYCSDLEALIEARRPALWIHGHTHYRVDYRIGATRVVSNPRGYMPNELVRGFDPAWVVAI